ncbi:uncharacterized protein KY384_009130 [Bacidia gigantensis]|uniref:uncharacterized protein n=1 Tax=Bacidia gigantensis TaxID=2732470 RepID=UPI001D053045|nr:uncharacterized protein KY384_009130 [Bacidia gigantensis]KAG8525486.1 hypothetical protein KY384_009130 [Bacidia gigantensis]
MVPQRGLEWIKTTFSLEPRWVIEPQLDDIKAEIQAILNWTGDFRVTFIAQGAFNKLYKVENGNDALVMRISLPVDPGSKTESEVATLHFMLENGEIPVPKVRAYDSSSSNRVGFEWILMDLMPGIPLHDRWRYMTWGAKEALIQQLATHYTSMYRQQFDTIGNAYLSSEGRRSRIPYIGKIVSMQFFWGDHISQDVLRGPFHSSQDWLSARLSFDESDSRKILNQSEDEDDREDAEDTLKILTRLRKLLPDLHFSPHEPTMFFHDDLSQHNILVDEAGNLTAVIDWECVSTLPLWKACQFPAFLEGRNRAEEPLQQNYQRDGQISDLFWDHLLEYELAQLRTSFFQQMEQLEPKWTLAYRSSQPLRDFDLAAKNCSEPFSLRTINAWLDDVENNVIGAQSLEQRLRQ